PAAAAGRVLGGVGEAGRSALARPPVAAAAVVETERSRPALRGPSRDSGLLAPMQRGAPAPEAA
ncbi:MAG: hypothetical protein PVF91_08800, partial [Chromatiales bacterium]